MVDAGWGRGGVLLSVGAATLALAAVTEAAWPAAVPDDRASYPFTPGGHVFVQGVNGIADLAVMAGLVVLLVRGPRLTGWLRTVAWLLPVAFAVFVVGQVVEVGQATASAAAAQDAVAPFFAAGSLVVGGAGVAAGIGLRRGRLWSGASTWVLVGGVVLFVVVLPTQFGAPPRVGDAALAAWAVTWCCVGAGVRRTGVGSGLSAPRATA